MRMVNRTGVAVAVLSVAVVMLSLSAPSLWRGAVRAAPATPSVAVAPQYDSTHVYVAPENADRFVASFLGTFGGKSGKQVVTTVTPTPSRTSSQVLQTPVGMVSLFGFKTPIPFPFGAERTGYLVTDLDAAVRAARESGAAVLVTPFADPIGRDAVIQWPGGVNMQLYWHTTAPSYAPLQTVPENRVYVSPESATEFIRGFLAFSHGTVVSDEAHASGVEIGQPDESYRRIRIASPFGKMCVLVTDGHLPYPYGRETTGYEVASVADTLAKAKAAGFVVLVPPYISNQRSAAMVQFPGGYVAEIQSIAGS
jgi:predicted enzyme related to lactoylglutathione lyase